MELRFPSKEIKQRGRALTGSQPTWTDGLYKGCLPLGAAVRSFDVHVGVTILSSLVLKRGTVLNSGYCKDNDKVRLIQRIRNYEKCKRWLKDLCLA